MQAALLLFAGTLYTTNCQKIIMIITFTRIIEKLFIQWCDGHDPIRNVHECGSASLG